MSAAEALLLRDGNLVQEGASEKGDMDTPTRAQLAAEGEDADEAFARLCAEQERVRSRGATRTTGTEEQGDSKDVQQLSHASHALRRARPSTSPQAGASQALAAC